MNNLPDSVILRILSFLEKVDLLSCCGTSRKWYNLCFDSSLWKSVSSLEFIDNNIEIQEDQTFKCLLKNFSLEKLDMSDCVNISNRTVMTVAFNSTQLTSLNLHCCRNITDRSISAVSFYCKNLEELNLCQTRVSETGLMQIFSSNPNLKDISVSPSALTEKAVNSLTANCKQLEVLVAEYSYLFDHDKAYLSSAMLSSISLNCKDLNILILRYPIVNIDDPSLCLLGHYCLNLHCIEIEHVFFHSAISDIGIINLCFPLKHLQRLVISYSCITDLTVYSLSQNNIELTQLSIKHCQKLTDRSIVNLLHNCSNLESLTVGSGWGGKLTNMSILAIAQSKCAKNLVQISMYGWDISDNGLILLLNNLTNLLNLSIEHCQYITKEGLLQALQSLPRLLTLDISSTNCLESNVDLIELGSLLPNLTTLSINNCRSIDFSGVRQFNSLFPSCEVVSNLFL